jgi:hypothetical protein
MFSHVTVFRRSAGLFLALLAMVAAAACGDGSKLVLTEQAEAHRIASRLRVEFSHAADASNRAVMTDTDEASRAAAHEAQQATQAVDKDAEALRLILEHLGDRDEAQLLDRFRARFVQYKALDADILPLAVENTNIKAQRLAFGPAQDAVSAYRQLVDAAAKMTGPPNVAAAEAAAARGSAAVLDIQVVEARHIAESHELAMTRMEAAMKASQDAARKAIDSLTRLVPGSAASLLSGAAEALDKLIAANAEIVALSRRNSNVRSLALSLGKKRAVTAECDEILQTLEDSLAKHHFAATR